MRAVTCFAVTILASTPLGAQQIPLKDKLVGAWELVSASSLRKDGPVPIAGATQKGMFIMAPTGHCSVQLIGDVPKPASNDRLNFAPDEGEICCSSDALVFRHLRDKRHAELDRVLRAGGDGNELDKLVLEENLLENR